MYTVVAVNALDSSPGGLFIGVVRGSGNNVCWGNLPWVPQAAGYDPKLMDTISSLPWHTAGEPHTPYQKTTPPLLAKEAGPTT
jgi:hypothetical protein